MQGDSDLATRQHQKVYTYWVDNDGRYIGRCLRYNRFLRFLIDIVYTVIWTSLLYDVVDSRHMYAVGFPLLLFTVIVYSQFLKRTAMYYLLDERGTPTEFLSRHKPESIRRARPLTRKQFLRRVGEGTNGRMPTPLLKVDSQRVDDTLMREEPMSLLKVNTYWIDDQHTFIGMCYRWNLYVMQGAGALITLTLWGIVSLIYRQPILTAFIAIIFGTTAYAGILIRAQHYYLLDEHGVPKTFRSAYRPDSIRHLRPLTRKQFLRRVSEGTTGTQA